MFYAPFVRMFNVFMCSFELLVFHVFYMYFMYLLVSMCVWHVLNKRNPTQLKIMLLTMSALLSIRAAVHVEIQYIILNI